MPNQENEPLQNINFLIYQKQGNKDSLIFNIKSKKTEVSFSVLPGKNYKIVTISDCCESISKLFSADTISKNHVFNLILKEKTIDLKELIVRSKKDRYEQKGDTLVINIKDEDFRPHAGANTLFDRIQGLNMGMGGNVSILGKNVQEVTVDGKRIFGGVASLTLENIKADMIDQMEFIESNAANGQKQNTLNLRLKENKKNGGYGNLGIGYGNNKNHSLNGNFSKITQKGFINIFSTSNTINERGIDPKTVERITINTFKKSMNQSGSIIGLYDTKTENSENEITRYNTNLLGLNRYFDSGLNYTYSFKKIEFDSFIFANLNKKNVLQESNKLTTINTTNQSITENRVYFENIKSINANFNLTWKISPKATIRLSNQLNSLDNRSIYKDTINSTFEELNINNFTQRNVKSDDYKFENIFQISGIKKGKKRGVVNSAYYQIVNTIPTENISFINNSTAFLTQRFQNQNILKENNSVYSNLQIVRSQPLNKRILLEGKIKQVTNTIILKQNNEIFNLNIKPSHSMFENKESNILTESSLYLLYKKPKFDLITGVGYWNWKVNRQTLTEKHAISPNFILNPFTKINFKLQKTNLSVKYAKEPFLPNWKSTINVADSSNLFALNYGNIYLNYFSQNAIDINASTSTNKGYQFSLNFNYNLATNALITKNTLDENYGVFASTFVNSEKPISNWNINLTAFQIKLNSKFSWFFLGGYFMTNSLVKTQNNLTAIKTNFGFLNFNTTLKLQKGAYIRANWKSQFNSLQGEFQSNHILTLKSEVDLRNKWYLDSGLRINANKTQAFNSQWFLDTELSKFLLKKNDLKTSLVLKNILNTKNDINITQSNNSQATTSTNYLPLTVLFKLTFYPETWKKN